MIVRLLMPVGALALVATAMAQQPDQASRSIALFREAGKVLQQPALPQLPSGGRAADANRSHDAAHAVRGARPDGHGAPGLPCNACHHAANYAESGVPGHPKWHLAPASMAWAGKSLGEICRQIKDPARNGGLDMPAPAAAHGRGHSGRLGLGARAASARPAPGTQAEFGATMRAWAETGAVLSARLSSVRRCALSSTMRSAISASPSTTRLAPSLFSDRPPRPNGRAPGCRAPDWPSAPAGRPGPPRTAREWSRTGAARRRRWRR